MNRIILCLTTALLVLNFGSAQAQVPFPISISPVNPTVHAGDTVTFSATVTNLTGGSISPGLLFSLGGLMENVSFPFGDLGLQVIGDSPADIFANQPDIIVPDGGSWSFVCFQVQVSSQAVPGPYSGHVEIDDSSGAAVSAGGDFSVTVASTIDDALAALADLRGAVIELVPKPGNANSLIAKVDAAKSSVLAHRIAPALDQLTAFGHEVDALHNSAQLSKAASNILKKKSETAEVIVGNAK